MLFHYFALIAYSAGFFVDVSQILQFITLNEDSYHRHFTNRFLDSHKGMTHPSPGSTVSTNIRKAFLVVTVRGTERYLFDSLIYD